jgi:hypothetical protein
MTKLQYGETRPVEIEAMQMVNLEDAGKIGQWMGIPRVVINYTHKNARLINNYVTDEGELIKPGWWVVRNSTNKYTVYPDEEFQKKFKLKRRASE